MNEAKKLHIKHNYYIQVEQIDGAIGCIVTFPEDKINQIDSKIRTYIYDVKTKLLEVYENQKKIFENYVPKFITRVLIIEDIIVNVQKTNMAIDLIISKEKNLFNVLKLDLSNIELNKEKQVIKIMQKILSSETIDFQKLEIDEDVCSLLFKCFDNGGL